MSELKTLLQNKLFSPAPHTTKPFTDELIDRFSGKALCIVLYGSTLSSVTQKTSSSPDFFIIVDNAKTFYQTHKDKFLSSFLPPNIYHFEVGAIPSKYNVVEMSQLERALTHPKDFFLLGRFSKRLCVVWAKNEQTKKNVLNLQAQAFQTIHHLAKANLDASAPLETTVFEALSLSYKGDVRVESNDKIQKIFEAEKDFYTSCHKTFMGTPTPFTKKDVQTLIQKSKRRALLRWPKGMLTAHDWLNYVIGKVERTQNIKIDLSPHQKKWWFIYGWKYVWILWKKNLIK